MIPRAAGRQVAVGVIMSAALSCHSTGSVVARVYPDVLIWTEAQQHCTPEYPQSSLEAGSQGLAVVQVEIARNGTVQRSTLIEAPDQAIGRSAIACANNIKAAPASRATIVGPPSPISRGKLYFYFTLWNNKGEVFVANDPQQKRRLRDLLATRRIGDK